LRFEKGDVFSVLPGGALSTSHPLEAQQVVVRRDAQHAGANLRR